MEQRQSGGRTLGRNKREKRESGHDGRVTHPAQGTFWFKAVNQMRPPPQTHTLTLLFLSIRVQMHLEESKQPQKAQNPKCMSVCVCERERENPDVSLPLLLPLPARLVGCLRAEDVCTLL